MKGMPKRRNICAAMSLPQATFASGFPSIRSSFILHLLFQPAPAPEKAAPAPLYRISERSTCAGLAQHGPRLDVACHATEIAVRHLCALILPQTTYPSR